MSKKDPKPEIMRLEELAILVKDGEIKLPRFQRPFVWRRTDMLKLLDSIYKGYPIGSLLIWNSSQRLTSERTIAGLEVDESRSSWLPTNYLLDGQQRLTTLCGALFWGGEDKDSIWNIHFDLDREEFLYPKDQNLVNLFPLNKLINTGDFIRQCMKFEHQTKSSEYVKISERLLRVIKDYKVAVVKIGDMTVEEVAPIFERINSTGRKLTIVDLMMAATWSNGFDLTQQIQAIKEDIRKYGGENLSEQIILRSIAAAADLGINKDDIQRLRTKDSEQLLVASKEAGDALVKAVTFLREKNILHDISYMPYGLFLTHLTEFYRLQKNPTENQLNELEKWFWYSSVTRYFSGANTGQNSKDLQNIRLFARGDIEVLFLRGEIDVTPLLYDRFNLRNATSTTFALILSRMSPASTLDGRSLDESYLKLKSSKLYGSFSPKGVDKLNISKIIFPFSDTPLLNNISEETLGSHILDRKTINAVKDENDSDFIEARKALLFSVLHDLTSCTVVSQPYLGAQSMNQHNDSDIEDTED